LYRCFLHSGAPVYIGHRIDIVQEARGTKVTVVEFSSLIVVSDRRSQVLNVFNQVLWISY